MLSSKYLWAWSFLKIHWTSMVNECAFQRFQLWHQSASERYKRFSPLFEIIWSEAWALQFCSLIFHQFSILLDWHKCLLGNPSHTWRQLPVSVLGGQSFYTAVVKTEVQACTGRNAFLAELDSLRKSRLLPPVQIQGTIQMTEQYFVQVQFCSFHNLKETVKLLHTIQLEICSHE